MLEFFLDFGLFLAKTATVVFGIIVVAVVIVALIARAKQTIPPNHVEITKINDRFDDLEMALQSQILSKNELKVRLKAKKVQQKADKKKSADNGRRKKLFVLDFQGDIKASAVTELREEITAVMTVARPEDEVFVRLESPGGLVHAYGLAASQLKRITDKQIPLTVAVDKVAASGGYMMACVANKIIAAPFAILGSIGVVAQIPNVNRLLKKHDVDFELITAGEYKRTLTVFGENTDKARDKFKADIEDTHELFKTFIHENRADVDIEHVATGEHWFGTRAKALNLVDVLQTSDDYLLNLRHEVDIFTVSYETKKSLGSKLSHVFGQVLDKLLGVVSNRLQQQYLP